MTLRRALKAARLALALAQLTLFGACTLAIDLDHLGDGQCPDGEKLCNDECVSTRTPATGCGNRACAPCNLPHATANCDAEQRCAIAACTGAYRDCNRTAADGCEIDTDHDPLHCGSCTATPCSVPNAIPDCGAGRCAIRSCNTGFGDCNSDARDGCETDVLESDVHCSRCNTPCPTGCANGQCG